MKGIPKSGRVWKVEQSARTSSTLKKGILSHLSKSVEARNKEKERVANMKALEKALTEEKIAKKINDREVREAKQKQRMENEFKTSTYQTLNTQKIKTMSKKQLRMVKKTQMNKNGQVELVNMYGNGGDSNTKSTKRKKK